MPQIKLNNDVVLGGLLMGMTGILIGVVINSPLTMFIAGTFGLLTGTLVGWIGGRFYLFIVCFIFSALLKNQPSYHHVFAL